MRVVPDRLGDALLSLPLPSCPRSLVCTLCSAHTLARVGFQSHRTPLGLRFRALYRIGQTPPGLASVTRRLIESGFELRAQALTRHLSSMLRARGGVTQSLSGPGALFIQQIVSFAHEALAQLSHVTLVFDSLRVQLRLRGLTRADLCTTHIGFVLGHQALHFRLKALRQTLRQQRQRASARE